MQIFKHLFLLNAFKVISWLAIVLLRALYAKVLGKLLPYCHHPHETPVNKGFLGVVAVRWEVAVNGQNGFKKDKKNASCECLSSEDTTEIHRKRCCSRGWSNRFSLGKADQNKLFWSRNHGNFLRKSPRKVAEVAVLPINSLQLHRSF